MREEQLPQAMMTTTYLFYQVVRDCADDGKGPSVSGMKAIKTGMRDLDELAKARGLDVGQIWNDTASHPKAADVRLGGAMLNIGGAFCSMAAIKLGTTIGEVRVALGGSAQPPIAVGKDF